MDKKYVDEDDPWKGILSAEAFVIRSTFHTTNKKSPSQLVFWKDMIVPIEHVFNWRLIYQHKNVNR